MRFFSNENREPDDESSTVDVQTRAAQENPGQAHDEHPERVESDPVAVPHQRHGSPWSDTPGSLDTPDSNDDNADAELADHERADGTEQQESGQQSRDHREAIALGGSQSGGSESGGSEGVTATVSDEADDHDGHDHGLHDDAVDLPLDDADSLTGEPLARHESTPVSTTTTYRPDGTVTTTEDVSAPFSDLDSDSAEKDTAIQDDGGFDDPTAIDPVTDRPLDSDVEGTAPDAEESDVEGTATDPDPADVEGTATDPDPADVEARDAYPAPVEPALVPVGALADDSGTDDSRTAENSGTADDSRTAENSGTAADTTPAAPAADKLPGSVTAPDLGKIFAADDAQSFQDRWREVQLRFVDSPKEATAEAATLLDEVVDKLATSLRAQKDSLSTDTSDDTEQLRVELRGYRDILNRVLGL